MHNPLSSELQVFMDYLKFEKRYASHTIESYRSDLTFFFDFMQLQYELADLKEVQAAMIRGWLASMKEQGHAARTINRRISALKSFYRFLQRKGLITAAPTTMIVSPKVSKRLPVYVEAKDMNTLFSHIEFPDSWTGRLERLIFALFYATGMRLSELTGLKETQVDLARQQLKILGKGNKERIIPVSADLQQMLSLFLKEKKDRFPEGGNEFLLISEKGKPIYPRYVQAIVQKYLQLVTTIEKKSPHVWGIVV